jgi:hypothetical protein
MLTPKEFKQIEAAVKAMYTYAIKDEDYIMRHNVLAVLQTFVEEEKKPAPPKGPTYRGEFGDVVPAVGPVTHDTRGTK